MEKEKRGWTLEELAQVLSGEAEGDSSVFITGPVQAGEDDPSGLSFAESEEYLAQAEATTCAAVIVSRDCRASTKPLLRVDTPRLAFFQFLHMSKRELPLDQGVHETAIIEPGAHVNPTARIGAYAVVVRGARVGPKARIFPFCYVGEDCDIGEGATLYPHVVLYQNVKVGVNSIIHSGAVLGADGFGFVWDGKRRIKVPQVGGVDIASEVEVGANTTIDRATAGTTSVGTGTKLDNLVQVGHNVKIGEHSVIAGMAGISGSTKIGDRVVMGGGVGTNDHITIADDVVLGGRSGVDRDITEPGNYFGTPARPVGEAMRAFLLIPKLPELASRIRKLEKLVEKLENGEKD